MIGEINMYEFNIEVRFLLAEFDLFAVDSCVSCNKLENDRIKEKELIKTTPQL